jgi:phosphoribosylformylglycinamidine synthase
VEIELDDDLPPVAVLFGEAQGRVVVSCAPDDVAVIMAIAGGHGVPARRIGSVGGPRGAIRIRARRGHVHVPHDRAAEAYFSTLQRIMDAPAGSVS